VGPGQSEIQGPVDPAFEAIEEVQQLPRLVFALLRSPLLSPSASPDEACALRALCLQLPPAELAALLYPHLSSWESPDNLAFPRHSLCAAALAVSRRPLYMLDAYTDILVFYAATEAGEGSEEAGCPFPPPSRSALWRHIAAARHARLLTPRVTLLREWADSGAWPAFSIWLLEDGGGEGQPTFMQFLEEIRAGAVEALEG
jgi:hypothetical protein